MMGLLDLLGNPEALARIENERAQRAAITAGIAACYGVRIEDAAAWLYAWETSGADAEASLH
jgi:hypothetical protein